MSITKDEILGNLRSTVKQDPNNTSGNLNTNPITKDSILSGMFDSGIDRSGVQQKDLSEYSDYIENPVISPNVDLDATRAENQSGTEQYLRAVGTGLAGGLLTAVEALSYIPDGSFWAGTLVQADDYERNFLAEWAVNTKESLNENFAIYRTNPEKVFDFGDFGWYMDTFKSVIDSAVGFGLPGIGVAKGISMAGKTMNYLAKTQKLMSFLNQTEKGAKLINSLASGYVTNHMESMVMATEMYDTLLSDYNNNPGKYSGISLDEFKREAARQTHNFALYNKIFAVTNALQMGSLFKTRGQISKAGLKNFAIDQLKTAPLEGVEEVGQRVLQESFTDSVRANLGVDTKYNSKDFLGKAMEIVQEEETWLEGLMGIFGGPVQYAITKAPFEIASMKEANKWREKQAEVILNNKEQIDKVVKQTIEQAEVIDAAKIEGSPELAEAVADAYFGNIVINNFKYGIADQLERTIQDVIENKDGTRSESEISIAQEKLEQLKEFEREFNKATKYVNSDEIFGLKARILMDTKALEKLTNQEQELIKDIIDVATINNKVTVADKVGKDTIIRNRPLNVEYNVESGNVSLADENIELRSGESLDTVLNKISNEIQIQQANDVVLKNIKSTRDRLNKTKEEYAKAVSFENQKKLFKADKADKQDRKLLKKLAKTPDPVTLEQYKDDLKTEQGKYALNELIRAARLNKAKEAEQQSKDAVAAEQDEEIPPVPSDVSADDIGLGTETNDQPDVVTEQDITGDEVVEDTLNLDEEETLGTVVTETKNVKDRKYHKLPNNILYPGLVENPTPGTPMELLNNKRNFVGTEILIGVDKSYQGVSSQDDYSNPVKAPIAIYEKLSNGLRGRKLGFLKPTSYIQNKGASKKDIDNLNKLRELAVAGDVSTTITEFSDGGIQPDFYLNETNGNLVTYRNTKGEFQSWVLPISETFGSDVIIGYKDKSNRIIGVKSNGDRFTFEESQLDKATLDGNTIGSHVALFQVGVDSKGNPVYRSRMLHNNKLSQDMITGIVQVLDAYQNQNEAVIKKFADKNIDIKTFEGVVNYLSHFIHIRDSRDTSHLDESTNYSIVVQEYGNTLTFRNGNNPKSYESISVNFNKKELTTAKLNKIAEYLSTTFFTMNVPNEPMSEVLVLNENKELVNLNNGTDYLSWVKQNLFTDVKAFQVDITNPKTGDVETHTRIHQHPNFLFDIENIVASENIENITQAINAKYDAELAALENSKTSNLSNEEQSLLDMADDLNNDFNLSINLERSEILQEALDENLFTDNSVSQIFRAYVTYTIHNILSDIKKNNSLKIDTKNYVADLKNTVADKISSIDKLAEKLGEAHPSYNKLQNSKDIFTKVSDIPDSKISEAIVNKLSTLTTVKTKLNEDQDAEAEIGLEDNSQERNDFSSSYSLTQNSAASVGPMVKVFLSDIKDPTKKDILGNDVFVSPDDAYNTLHSILAGVEPNFDTMINTLSAYNQIPGLEWITNAINDLKGSPDNVKTGFVTDMAKHKVEMYFVQYTLVKNNDGTYSYKFTVVNDNSSDDSLVIKELWANNLYISSPLTIYNETSKQRDVNKDAVDTANNLISIARETIKQPEATAEEKMLTFYKVLDFIGMEISDADSVSPTLQDLYDNGLGKSGKGDVLLSKILNNIEYTYIKPLEADDVDLDTYDPLRAGLYTQIAQLHSKYSKRKFASAFRVGSKSIWTYSNNKYLNLRLQQLKSFTDDNGNFQNSELGKTLSQTVFSRKHFLIDELLDKDSVLNFGGDDSEILSMKYNSLSPFKKGMKGKRKDKALRDSAEGEHEMEAINMFAYNTVTKKGNSVKGVNLARRKAFFFFPTFSDKESTILIPYYAFKTDFTADGELGDKMLTLLYESLVTPELDRILNITDSDLVDLTSYQKDIFYILPELNDFKPEGGEGKTYLQLVHEADKYKPQVLDLIKKRITTEVDRKLNLWQDNNIGVDTEIKKGSTTQKVKNSFINSEYLALFDNDINKAATDMVVNYMLFNSGMQAAVIGDPAEYYKAEGNNKDDHRFSGLSKDALNALPIQKRMLISSERKKYAALDTYRNIGKRLAGEIAPGNQLAMENNKDDFYVQLFMNDTSAKASGEYLNTLEKIFGKNTTIGKAIRATYSNIEATDAQEYTTYYEHFTYMRKLGKMTQAQMDDFIYKIENNLPLEVGDLAIIFQPVKPVYVDSKFEDLNNGLKYGRRIYIKTSSFPLIPQLTKNKSIDNLRVAMETIAKQKDGIGVRAVFKSGTKVGFPKKGANVFNKGTLEFKSAEDILKEFGHTDETINDSYKVLSREGLRNQQENPPKDKYVVNRGTQESKLLFMNILDETIKDGVKGRDLLQVYEDTYDKLFKLKRDVLHQQTIDESGKIDIRKVQKILNEEAIAGDYNINDIKFLQLETDANGEPRFKIPLELNPSSRKFQALLNSIVSNRILKLKPPGYAWYLGSEAGFGIKEYSAEDFDKNPEITDGVTYFSKKVGNGYITTWDGKYLDGMRYNSDGTKMLPAQVLLHPKILLKGKPITDYIKYGEKNGRKYQYIDISNDGGDLDAELLKLFGHRIPGQGHNSMAMIEIVGLLPETSGDLIIAPMHFTKQMGSDFDIDKLYSYMYASYVDEKTRRIARIDESSAALEDKLIKSIFSEDELISYNTLDGDELKSEMRKNKVQEAILFNKILDIHKDVLLSTNKNIQKHIHYALGFDTLKYDKNESTFTNPDNTFQTRVNNAEGIANAIAEKRESSDAYIPSLVSQDYQRTKYTSANAAATAIGAFATALTFHSISQKLNYDGTPLKAIQEKTKAGIKYHDLSFGSFTSPSLKKGELGNTKVVGSDNYISNVISAFLSSALDNEKENILEKINITRETIPAINTMMLAGYPAELIAVFMSQPIVLEYVKEVQKNSSSLVDYTPNVKAGIYASLKNKYIEPYYNKEMDLDEELYTIKNIFNSSQNLVKDLFNLIGETPADKSSAYKQIAILDKFVQFEEVGENIKTLQSTINTDSKFLGKTVIHTVEKAKRIKDLAYNQKIQNASKLIGNYLPYSTDVPIDTLKAEGYVNVGNGYIKPTSISGFASVYGTLYAEQLYQPIFPILHSNIMEYETNPEIISPSMTFSQIMQSVAKTGELGIEQIEDMKLMFLDELKSFIYAQPEFLGNNPVEIRSRLLNKDTGLASVLTKLREHENSKIRNYVNSNTFLSRLEVQGFKDAPNQVAVTYRAALQALQAEEDIHNDFLKLFSNNTTELLPGITPYNLGEMLVEYAFATGGVQGAKEFIKYIPSEIIQASVGAKYLHNISNRPNEFGVNLFERQFIVDFFQNNINLLNDFSDTLEYNEGSNTYVNPDFPDTVLPEFGYVMNGDDKILVINKTINGLPTEEYIEYPTKGYRFIKEYGAVHKDVSIFKDLPVNNIPIQQDAPSDTPMSFIEKPINDEGINNPNIAPVYFKELLDKQVVNGVKGIKDTLDAVIENSQNEYFVELASVYLRNIDKVKQNVTLLNTNEFSLPSGEIIDLTNRYKANGTHFYTAFDDTHTIVINPDLVNSADLYEETLLHEIGHMFTKLSLKAAMKDDISKTHYANINREYLRYRTYVKDKLGVSDKALDEYSKTKNFEQLFSEAKTTTKGDSKRLATAASIMEFVTHAISDKVVMSDLNGLEAGKVSKLIDRIVKMIKEFLGLKNINANSSLEATISELFHILDTSTSAELNLESKNTDSTSGQTLDLSNSLNSSIAEFLRTLPSDERRFARDMINSGQLKTKCK